MLLLRIRKGLALSLSMEVRGGTEPTFTQHYSPNCGLSFMALACKFNPGHSGDVSDMGVTAMDSNWF